MIADLALQITEAAQSRETKALLRKFLKTNKITLTSFVDAYNSKFDRVGYTSFHYKANKNGSFTSSECNNINQLITETIAAA